MHSLYDHKSLPPETAPANHDDITTDSETDVGREDLELSKTCDDTCCDHSHGCKCCGCFCQVRTGIQINANQTTYAGKGGSGVGIAHGEAYTGTNDHCRVNALAANLASPCTDLSGSGSIDIAPHGLGPDSLVAPPSFDILRRRDARQSYEERMRVNVQRLGLDAGVDIDESSDFDDPGYDFISAVSDCEPIFEFEPNGLSRFNSHELPPEMLGFQGKSHTPHASSRNASIALQGTGRLFDTISIANLSQYNLEVPLCFGPLQLVPECRHGRAAECA